MVQPRVAASNQRFSMSALQLIQGSFSAGRITRRSPLVGGLHRLADGTLLGVFAALAVLAGLTLHWQHRWTMAFQRFEATKLLSHRLTESTALLEQHWLDSTTSPSRFVPTKVTNLIHLERSPVVVSDPSVVIARNEPSLPRVRPGY